jgi:parvulin-like peptidyl-prolyl isomerase
MLLFCSRKAGFIMMFRMLRLVAGVVLVLTCAVTFAVAAQEGVAVVAVVNGISLSEAELNQEIGRIMPQNKGFHGNLSPEKMSKIRSEAMQKLVDSELQFQDARKKGMKAEEAELKASIDTFAARFKSVKEFQAAIIASGFDEQGFSRFAERQMLVARIIQAEVDNKVDVSDASIKSFYENNSSRYSKPQEFRASHILFKVDPAASAEEREAVRKKAEDVLKRIKAGGNFAEIASKESDDLTKIKGGDLGYFHAGQTVSGFEDVLGKMNVGDTSDIVETIYGYHIVRLTDRKAPRVIPFEEMRDKIRADLVKSEKARLFDQWMSGLRSKAIITYSDSKAKPGDK